jgi:cellulose synthase/poly-beta-1,6-N-acetylglucosamine synthase-like glycosyltransferase
MLEKIIYILGVAFLFYVGYYLITSIGIFKKRKKVTNNNDDKKNFFAVIIAARNEENVIGKLIDSLKKQSYPSEYFDIYVIVNNCTDNTAIEAKKAGAKVISCTEKVSTKGEVLKYTFDLFKDNNKIDAYAIFDADNIVHHDFLAKMNDMINSGYSVAQGFRDTKNISDNWLTSSYAILYYFQSLFLNESRYNMGRSSFLNGTGFVIKKEVIDKHGFNPKTVTEDVEFTAMCAINNEKIGFATDAITYDEQTNSFDVSWKQRKRWSFGTMECLREYFPILLKKGIKERNFECFDVGLFYLSVILHVVFNLLPIFLLINIIIHFNSLTFDNMLYKIIFIVISYLFGVVVRIILLKRYNKSFKDNIGGVLLFDLFVFSWLPINFICLFIKSCNWDSIKHNRSVDIENV